MDVLAGRGFAAFTMEAVAEQSGIAKSTLYRHWADLMALMSDALETLNRQPRRWEPLRKSELRAGVIDLLEHLAAIFEGSLIARIMPALVEAAEHHPEVRTFMHDYSAARRRTLVRLLEEGAALGELAPDVGPELAALALSGPIFYRRFMTAAPFPKAEVAPLVGLILRSAP